MREDAYRYRTELLLTFNEKKYSQSSKHEIMELFGKLKAEQKENVAKAAIPLVKSSKTEQEVILQVKQLINQNTYLYRGEMLHLFLEKGFSISTEDELAYLFKGIPEEEKESLAKEIISLIETSKTEQEIITKAKRLKK